MSPSSLPIKERVKRTSGKAIPSSSLSGTNSSNRRRRTKIIQHDAYNHNRISFGLHCLLILFVLLWALAAYWTLQKLYYPSREGSTTNDVSSFAHHLLPTLLSCPVASNPPLRFTLQNPPESESAKSLLHLMVTPLSWRTGRFQQDDADTTFMNKNQAQTIMEYRRHYYLTAKFHALQTFCAASMKNQTSQNVYWVILIEDDNKNNNSFLRTDILPRLVKLVQEHNQYQKQRPTELDHVDVPGNAYLIVRKSHIDTGSSFQQQEESQRQSAFIGWHEIALDYLQGISHVVAGDQQQWDHVMKMIAPSSSKHSAWNKDNNSPHDPWNHFSTPMILMETHLPVDTALHHQGVEWLQMVAMQQEQFRPTQQRKSPSISSFIPGTFSFLSRMRQSKTSNIVDSWFFICGLEHLELHNTDIFFQKLHIYEELGISAGRLGRRTVTSGCSLAAGLTLVGMLDANPENRKLSSNDNHHQDVPISIGSRPSNLLWEVGTSTKHVVVAAATATFLKEAPLCQQHSVMNQICLWRISFPMPIATIGRTVTSDIWMEFLGSMEDLNHMKATLDMEGPMILNGTEWDWQLVENSFGLDRYHLWKDIVYLYEQTEHVLLGHPCTSNRDIWLDPSICSARLTENLKEQLKYVRLRRIKPQQSSTGQAKALKLDKLEKAAKQMSGGKTRQYYPTGNKTSSLR